MKKYLLILTLLFQALPAMADTIEIDADKKIEWYRNEQKMVAVGNAVAKKGETILKGQTITAFYERVQLEDGTQKNANSKSFS